MNARSDVFTFFDPILGEGFEMRHPCPSCVSDVPSAIEVELLTPEPRRDVPAQLQTIELGRQHRGYRITSVRREFSEERIVEVNI